jgi:hypothetical protein
VVCVGDEFTHNLVWGSVCLFAECNDPKLLRTGYPLILSLIWWGLLLIATVLFIQRRHLQPIKSRDVILVVVCVIMSVLLHLVSLLTSMMMQTMLCNWYFIQGYIFFPLFYFTTLLRAARLYFMYSWSQSKLKSDSLGFFHKHKGLLSRKSTAVNTHTRTHAQQ